jgi:regulatory protein
VPRKRQPSGSDPGGPQAALAAAAALLARRDYCSVELGAKLMQRGFEPEAIRAALASLIEQRYLDDARYAERFVTLRSQRGQGPLRIRRDLADLGLPSSLVDSQLQAQGQWPQLARQVLSRRFGSGPPDGWRDKARRARFLQYRGFGGDDIRFALGIDVDMELESDADQ